MTSPQEFDVAASGMLQHMDFRSVGERDKMSANLKLLAAIVLPTADTVRVVIEP